MERGMIKTLMFDLGGTLHTVKRTPASRLRFCAHLIDILGRHGIPVTLSPQELDVMLAVNGDEARLAPFAEEMSFLYDQERMENIPRPQLRETIEALHGMGIRLGVISNIISTTLVPYALKEYGIDRYMECVVMSSVTGIRKPDPRIFEIAMDEMHAVPAETGYVGDTISRDVLGSRNAGLGLCVRIDNPSIAHRDAAFQGPDAPKADYVIHELPELVPILSGINGPKA